MHMVKSIILSFAILLLFVGNVGVDVFKHICEEDGVSVAYVVNTIDHCKDHRKDVPPCCEEEEQKDCCDDEVDYFQMKLDFFQQHQLLYFVSVPDFQDIKAVFVSEIMDSEVRYFSNTDPPPLPLSKRLSIVQSYII